MIRSDIYQIQQVCTQKVPDLVVGKLENYGWGSRFKEQLPSGLFVTYNFEENINGIRELTYDITE